MVGFDGTPPSSVALDWVAEWAVHRVCRVEIATVTTGTGLGDGRRDDMLEQAKRRLADTAPDVEIGEVRASGRMPDALIRAAEHSDVLVIGAHRRRPVRSALTGWRPMRIAARSGVPVVVVPEDWTGSDGPVLVGVDDDSSSSAAVAFAAAAAARRGVGLTLLHAWLMPQPTMDGAVALLASPTELKAVHRRILDDACEQASALYPDVAVTRVLVRSNPSSALLSEARRSGLLVIGTHHRGVLSGALLGSVGQDTLPESRIPVCVVPAQPSADTD